ncbi:MAG: hypothetical protein HZA93_00810 [Verrucomicrobia bacterium]|nr:hypothetical protein [Verrucomicrobiota bacterium]
MTTPRHYFWVPAGLLGGFLAYYALSPKAGTRELTVLGGGPNLGRVSGNQIERQRVRLSGGDEYEGRDGRQEANEHFQRGRMVILSYGLYLPWDEIEREIWKRDYNVEYTALAGCIVSEPLVAYVEAYNQVMRDHIKTRFGSDVFALVGKQAREEFDRRWLESKAQEAASPTATAPGTGSPKP